MFGWEFAHSCISGIAKFDPSHVDKILMLSGNKGVFVQKLRKDVIAYPDCTWVNKQEDEDFKGCHARVLEIAQKEKVAMTYRNGEAIASATCLETLPCEHGHTVPVACQRCGGHSHYAHGFKIKDGTFNRCLLHPQLLVGHGNFMDFN